MMGCLGYGLLALGVVLLLVGLANPRPDKSEGLFLAGLAIFHGVGLIVAEKVVAARFAAKRAEQRNMRAEAETRVRSQLEAPPASAEGGAGDRAPEKARPKTQRTFECRSCGALGSAPGDAAVATCEFCGTPFDLG